MKKGNAIIKGQNGRTLTRIFERDYFVISEEGEKWKGCVFDHWQKSHYHTHFHVKFFTAKDVLFTIPFSITFNCLHQCSESFCWWKCWMHVLLWWNFISSLNWFDLVFLFLRILLCQYYSLILCGTKTHD